jgi:RsiW-degrading membrane proteinase PrsW (M82 family)
MRGKRRKNLDHPYATMFYSALISAAFSIVENIQYAQRAAYGEFGPVVPESVLTIRAVTSVIIHMACGLFMGYYIGRAKGATKLKKIFFNILGIGAAAFIHGTYDFNWMKPGTEKDYVAIAGYPIHVSSVIIIGFSLAIAFLMSWHLKHLNHDKTKIQ